LQGNVDTVDNLTFVIDSPDCFIPSETTFHRKKLKKTGTPLVRCFLVSILHILRVQRLAATRRRCLEFWKFLFFWTFWSGAYRELQSKGKYVVFVSHCTGDLHVLPHEVRWCTCSHLRICFTLGSGPHCFSLHFADSFGQFACHWVCLITSRQSYLSGRASDSTHKKRKLQNSIRLWHVATDRSQSAVSGYFRTVFQPAVQRFVEYTVAAIFCW